MHFLSGDYDNLPEGTDEATVGGKSVIVRDGATLCTARFPRVSITGRKQRGNFRSGRT